MCVSVSTLQRHVQRRAIKKGERQEELFEAARREMIDRVTSDPTIREEVARLITDDLAHAAALRRTIAVASEHLVPTNLTEAALVMRAAAAYSTALKNTADMLRRVLRIDKAANVTSEGHLPELFIREVTDDEATAMASSRLEEEK